MDDSCYSLILLFYIFFPSTSTRLVPTMFFAILFEARPSSLWSCYVIPPLLLGPPGSDMAISLVVTSACACVLCVWERERQRERGFSGLYGNKVALCYERTAVNIVAHIFVMIVLFWCCCNFIFEGQKYCSLTSFGLHIFFML